MPLNLHGESAAGTRQSQGVFTCPPVSVSALFTSAVSVCRHCALWSLRAGGGKKGLRETLLLTLVPAASRNEGWVAACSASFRFIP